MTTMILGGLWHGANLTFVFWGFIHGLFIAASHLFGQRLRGFLGWFLTFHIVVLAWVYFRSPDIKAAHKFFFQIFNLSNVSFNTSFPLSCLLVLVICLLTHYYGPKGLKFKCINRISNLPWLLQTLFYSFVFISIIIGEQHFNPFIYFQF